VQHQLNEVQGKLDETNRTLNDFDAAKKKLSIENSDLLRQLEEAESQVSQLAKIKISLTTQLEDTKRLADEEGRVSFIRNSSPGHAIIIDIIVGTRHSVGQIQKFGTRHRQYS